MSGLPKYMTIYFSSLRFMESSWRPHSPLALWKCTICSYECHSQIYQIQCGLSGVFNLIAPLNLQA